MTSSQVRRIVQHLQAKNNFRHIIAVIKASLIQGISHPWMYEVLAISMRLENYSQKDIERVLLSQVDYTAKDISSMLYSAAFLSRLEYKEQSLALCKQASSLDPYRPEPYIKGLDLARRLKNSDAIKWTTVGVIKHDWTSQHEKRQKKAMIIAQDEIRNLQKQNKRDEANVFQRLINDAIARDLVIELVWSGDGELDFSISEPSGTVCSHENRLTKAGGMYLHDGYGPKQKNCYEKYVNRIAPSGEYIITVHQVNVEGNIVGNRATLKITENKNSKKEKTITRSVLIARTDSVVKFSLKSGRRQITK